MFCKRRNAIIYDAPIKIDNKYWFSYANAIYSYEESDGKINKEADIPNAQMNSFSHIANVGKKIILAPFCAKNIVVYDTETKCMKYLDWEDTDAFSYYRRMAVFGDKVFMLPGRLDRDILVVEGLKIIRCIRIANWEGKVLKYEHTAEFAIEDNYLWITAHYSNKVLKLDMNTEQYEMIEIDKDSVGYTGIVIDNEYLWLAESNTGGFVRYNMNDGRIKKFIAPAGLDYNSSGKSYIHQNIFNFDEYVVSTPALCGKMTILNKKTDEINIVNTNFFDFVLESKANYKYGNYPTCSFGKKIDENTLWVQRALDGEIACINVDNFIYTIFSFELQEKELNNIYVSLYSSEDVIFRESQMMPLNSLIYFMKKHERKITIDGQHNIGTEIWKEIRG